MNAGVDEFGPTKGQGRRTPDASVRLASKAAKMRFADLSPKVVAIAKWGILDTLGVCLAATAPESEYLQPVRALLAKTGSAGTVPAPALGKRYSLFDGILWLGALSHTLDFDDVAGYSHPSAPVVCAALPVAHQQSSVTGEDFITAVALGQDLVIRLAQALPRPVSEYGWLPSIPGTMGAALATSKVLGLEADRTQNSLGLALHQTCGTMQALARPGSAYRAIREGFNARAGALAAILAGHGMAGDDASIEGRFGYFDQYFKGEYDAEFLNDPELLGPLDAFKPWPCAGHPQLFLTAVADLLKNGLIRPDYVKSVRLIGCSDLLPQQCAPLAERAAPIHSIDAKSSIPFLVGKLIQHGNLTLDDFSKDGLLDHAAIDIGLRVEWALDPGLKRGSNGFGRGVVEIEHYDGTRVRAETEFPLGHPENPLTWPDLVKKFRACVAASTISSSVDTDEIIEFINSLEFVPDAGKLLELVFEGGHE